MNEYDSNRIYDLAKQIGYYKTNDLDEAHCYVLNTCHIREKATDKVYHDVGRVKKNFRNKKKPIVIITGCVAQAEGEIILKKEKYIDAVIGPQSYHHLNETILKIEKKSERVNSTEFDVIDKFDSLNLINNSSSHVSSFLTIQEGCDKFCKFCVVPYTRGPEYSRPINELLNECKNLVNNGVKEITLLGQNVNAFSNNGTTLAELITKISKINNLKRIRYTTSHPIDFSEDLILVHRENEKLMPLIHLPVQSGSNEILKKMNRKHSVEFYIDLIEKLKKINPKIEFSSDFIIGFPGETEKDFDKTVQLLKKVNFINTYSFIYSPRPGTPAAKMQELNESIVKERLKIFQQAAQQIKLSYRRKLLNKKSLVLFENKLQNKDEFFGRDEYSNSVVVKSKEKLEGKIKEIKIMNGNHNTLFGEIDQNLGEEDFAA
tara:strand:- start:750 stop:2045 length:1296 start_codon:yes stop_codon:yes gene_type:complete